MRPPSRVLLIVAGALTQLIGVTCLVLALASLPVVHDLRSGTQSLIASVVAAFAAIVCGTLVYRGRLIPLALATGLDLGFGIVLPRGGSAIGSLLRILPADEAGTAETLVAVGAVIMFVAALLCLVAVPTALKLRSWARAELEREAASSLPGGGEPGESAPTNPLGRPVVPFTPQTPPGGFAPPFRPSVGGPARPGQFGGGAASALPLPPPPSTDVHGQVALPPYGTPSTKPGYAVPPAQPPKSASTLPGLGPSRLVPTQVLRVGPPRSKPLVIAGVAVSVIAIGVVVITATTGSDGAAAEVKSGSGSARLVDGGVASPAARDAAIASATDAGVPADASGTPPPDELVTRLHAALVHAGPIELGALLEANAFAFGVEAHEVAEGRDAVVAMLRHDLGDAPARGFEVTAKFTQLGHEGPVAWLAEEVRVGSKTFVTTAVAGLHGGGWTIAALHWAVAMPNETAYKLARDNDLAVPDAIPDTHDSSPLATAMRTAFASKPSFVEARSLRPDAFNFGSAPGERIARGDTIKKTFAKIRATIHLHDAVKVGALGEAGGWGAANIDFTDADRDGTDVTQTFRVLVAWIKEDAGWRIVQTQWSNAR